MIERFSTCSTKPLHHKQIPDKASKQTQASKSPVVVIGNMGADGSKQEEAEKPRKPKNKHLDKAAGGSTQRPRSDASNDVRCRCSLSAAKRQHDRFLSLLFFPPIPPPSPAQRFTAREDDPQGRSSTPGGGGGGDGVKKCATCDGTGTVRALPFSRLFRPMLTSSPSRCSSTRLSANAAMVRSLALKNAFDFSQETM